MYTACHVVAHGWLTWLTAALRLVLCNMTCALVMSSLLLFMANTNKSEGVGIRVTPEQKAQLQALAKALGVTMAEAACQAIEAAHTAVVLGRDPTLEHPRNDRLSRARTLAQEAIVLAGEMVADAQRPDGGGLCGGLDWDENVRLAIQLLRD